MQIPYINLSLQWKKEKKFLGPIIDNVLEKGNYVGGEEIKTFEKNICRICKVKYAVALNSGTDALTLSLHLLGIKKGDEVGNVLATLLSLLLIQNITNDLIYAPDTALYFWLTTGILISLKE